MSAQRTGTRPCSRCGGTGREMDWRDLGRRVRAAREKAGLSLRSVAARVGCSPAYLSDLEHGRRGGGLSGPKTRAILRLVKVKP